MICEQGCDPGIDHMLAMEYIDRVHAQGGKVREKSALEVVFVLCAHDHAFTAAFTSSWPVGLGGQQNVVCMSW